MFLARRRFARPGPRAVHLLTMIIRSARPSRREGYAERAPPPSDRSLLPRGHAPPPQESLQARLRTLRSDLQGPSTTRAVFLPRSL